MLPTIIFLLEYSGKDKLYVPADRIALVQRFKGTEGITPSLDRLGSVAWTQGKEKARKAIEKNRCGSCGNVCL